MACQLFSSKERRNCNSRERGRVFFFSSGNSSSQRYLIWEKVPSLHLTRSFLATSWELKIPWIWWHKQPKLNQRLESHWKYQTQGCYNKFVMLVPRMEVSDTYFMATVDPANADTFWDLERVSWWERCPDFRGKVIRTSFYLHWDKTKCPD